MSNMFGPPPGLSAALPVQSSSPVQQNPTVQMEDRLVIGPCIISYPAVLVPKKKMGGTELEYSAEFLVLMETPEQHKVGTAIYERMMAVANALSQMKFQRNADTFPHKPIRNITERKGFTGRNGFFFSARSDLEHKPTVLMGKPAVAVTDPGQIYPGAIVYCAIRAGWYDQGGNKGIKWYLNQVLKIGDGPRLAGENGDNDPFAEVLASLPDSQPVYQGAPAYQAPPAFGPAPGYQQAPQAMPQQGFQQEVMPQYQMPPAQGYAAPMGTPAMPGYR